MVPRREGLIARQTCGLITGMKLIPLVLFALLSGMASAETAAPATAIPAEVV